MINEIEVKCPRCRYRYTAPVSPGINELACVCERCGTPFTFSIYNETADGNNVAVPPPPPGFNNGNTATPHPTYPDEASKGQTTVTTDEATSGSDHTSGDTPTHTDGIKLPKVKDPAHKQGGCGKISIIALIAVAFIVLVNLTHPKDDNYPASDTDLSEQSTTLVDNTSSSIQGAPRWVQGKWHATTPEGTMTVVIRGDKISCTLGEESLNGSYYYQTGCLYCNYGDGMSIYKLLYNSETIETNDGIELKKGK